MKFIDPSVKYWKQPEGIDDIWFQIARATRVCYQSKPREGETDKKFVERVILKPAQNKDGSYDFGKMHGAMLEHGTVYLIVDYHNFTEEDDDNDYDFNEVQDFYDNNRYSKTKWTNNLLYVTTNMRVIIENNRTEDLRFISKPTKYHPKRYTFSVITDIGVTREINRHRTFSVAEQSTRYCDFLKDKFGGELTYVLPAWCAEHNTRQATILIKSFEAAEKAYKELRENGYKPEQARQVLPLGLKTQAVYTAYADDWKHFLALRADNASGKSHPNMQYVANEIKRIAKEQKLW